MKLNSTSPKCEGNGTPNGRNGEEDGEDEEIQFRAPTQNLSNGHVIAGSGGNSEVGAEGGGDSSLALMQLKLQLAREERAMREKEMEKLEMQREMRERDFEIEKQRAELGLHAAT